MSNLKELPIYRDQKDTTGIPIAKVGIRNVKAPFTIFKKYCGETTEPETMSVLGEWSIYTDLSKKLKGISMSLLQRILFQEIRNEVSTKSLVEVSERILKECECNSAYVCVKFPIQIEVASPKSKILGWKNYNCEIEITNIKGKVKKYLTVDVQYIATCPCSLELAKHLKETEGKESGGHQQRGFAKVKIEFGETIWIEDLIKQIEKAVVAIPYPIIRKPDEQFICYTARQNPLFVEEAARVIALALKKNKLIRDFVVVCNHQESIHQSDAVAIVRKGGNLK